MSVSAWDAAAVGEYTVSIIALILLCIVSLLAVRRRKDSPRLPFLWLKCAIPLFFLYIVLSEAATIIYIVIEKLSYPPDPLYEAASRIFAISHFFSSMADNFILLCLVELALSFLCALGNNRLIYRIIRYSNFFAVTILFVLAVAALGEQQRFISNIFDGSNVGGTTASDLYGTYYIIYWIASLGLLFLSIFVLYCYVQKKQLRSLTYLFFATSLLNLIRSTWEFSIAVRYDIHFNPFTSIPQYIEVVDPILYTWITISMFGLLIAIGSKQWNGPWSRQQQPQQQQPQQQQPQQQQPQQQQLQQQGYMVSGGGVGQGQGILLYPTYIQNQPTSGPGPGPGSGNFNLYQQPAQAEVVGSVSPVWSPKLAGADSSNSSQQYYGIQYQQQQPQFVQNPNQTLTPISVLVPVEAAAQPYPIRQQM